MQAGSMRLLCIKVHAYMAALMQSMHGISDCTARVLQPPQLTHMGVTLAKNGHADQACECMGSCQHSTG